MDSIRKIKKIFKSVPTQEGAGVHLYRGFGNEHVPQFDPFLLFDDFGSDEAGKYIKGFPWHPHRGIETITYVLEGQVEHSDSLGNSGIINAGDVQWMTAGSGIIHQEMPKGNEQGILQGLQLWANLPASDKMMPPRYREVLHHDIPEVQLNEGITIKVIAGEVANTQGPVKDIRIDPEYLAISIPAGVQYKHEVKNGHTVFAYVLEGEGYFEESDGSHDFDQDSETDSIPELQDLVGPKNIVLYEEGNQVQITADKKELRLLLISGKPLGEAVAWYGPIVMNTEGDIRKAFEEYQNGTFIKSSE